LRIGRLRHRVTIQSATNTSDGMGGYTEAWGNLDTVWAAIEPFKGDERYEVQKLEADLSHKIILRYRSGILPNMRINFDSKVFEIIYIINRDERNIELELHCREIVL